MKKYKRQFLTLVLLATAGFAVGTHGRTIVIKVLGPQTFYDTEHLFVLI